jgi:hypothetical protein
MRKNEVNYTFEVGCKKGKRIVGMSAKSEEAAISAVSRKLKVNSCCIRTIASKVAGMTLAYR